MQKSHRNTSLSQPSLQQRHTPSSGACALLQKNCESLPPLQPRCKSPTVTRLFLSLPCNRHTRFGRCVSTSTKKCKFPPVQPRFKGPTVTRHILSHTCSRDTRLWAVRPHFSPQNASFHLSTDDANVPPLHVASSTFPTAETHAFRAVPPHFIPKFARVATSPPTIQKSYRNTSFFSFFFVAETRAFGRCVFAASKRAPNSATTTQRSHGNTSLPQTSLQKRHLPLCGASPLHTHRIASVSTFPTTIQKVPRFLSLLYSRDTRLWAVRPHISQKLQKKKPLHPRCKSPTVTPRFLSLLHSGDTHLRAVPPHFTSKKFARVATSPTTMQKSHRDTSLSSAFSSAETHAFSGAGSPLQPRKFARVSTSPTTIQESHRVTSLSLPSPQ